jgi:hypothetical protein
MIAFICGTGGLWFFLEYSANKGTGYVVLAMLLYLSGFLFSPSVLPFMGIYPLALFFFTELPVRTIVRIFVTLLVTGLIIQFLPELFTTASSGDADYIRNPLFHESSLAVKTGTGLVSLLFYLRLLLYPFPLIYYYGYDMIPVNHAGLLRIMISLVLYAFFFIYAILKSREKHFSSFAIFWYLLTVSWFSNFLFPVDGIVGEQYVFNASLGFSMILSVFLFNLFGTDPRSLTIEMDARLKIVTVFILVLIPFIVLTIKRNRDWYSAETLYSNDIKYLSRSAKANLDIGNYYLHKRDTARAITCLERSCSIYPGTALYTTLANLYRLKGDPLKAAWYRYQAEKGTGKPRKTD